MGRVRARVGMLPIHAFSSDDAEPYDTAFATISQHYNIHYWKDLPEVIRQALENNEDVLASDGHWNEQGHRLIANRLAEHLAKSPAVFARQ